MSTLYALVGLVVLQRLVELWHAAANTRRLRARGAVEIGARHYPAFVVLHGAWLGSLLVFVPPDAPPHGLAVAGLALLAGGRLWVIASLGPFWTTRILTLPGAPLVRRGPYRLLRHPNYWVVAGEIALLPLAFDAVALAVVFSAANGALLALRVETEEAALAGRPVSVRGTTGESG
ncbi:isoprenylcysteine carboxyl methyltransferase family protein [Magnetospirillum sp. UT-4]|uniref:isoprenylcysteine carboxyl methyltransferase family protein n=1 Tax=Magnetospirillum sp. UT-4 TaxID=2681467 RepID=UPI001380A289|nr:isoprenylcysteine carboxylmethyltransferase family protein [Magnetospirillum sp. UT-4]CAA7616067.1 conserved membrane hypothetical protein [Magnetospirillum sp. UT-4]